MEIAPKGLSLFLMFALPLGLGVYLTRRFRLGWRLFLVGGVTFVLSQIGHLPFNSIVINPVLARLGFPQAGPGAGLALTAAILGLSAGLFEEGARYLIFRFWIRSARTWSEGVLFGAGHGGTEAMLLGVFLLLQHIQAYALRGQDLSQIVPAEQLGAAEAQLAAYWASPPALFLLAPVERVFAMAVQISLAVLVLQGFVRGAGLLWLGAAIGWHAVVDGVAVFLGITWGAQTGSLAGAVSTEVAVGILAAVSVWIVLRLRGSSLEPQAATGGAPAQSKPS
jgi:uncharacterized membrane protein YhfC